MNCFNAIKFIFIIAVFFIWETHTVLAANPGDVVFNEIAWMGTRANSADEWLELYNNTGTDIDLSGWKIYEAGGQTLIVTATSTIKAKFYYLIERTDDNTISDIPADYFHSWGGSGLNNNGEYLQLRDTDNQLIDEVKCSATGWFAGDNSAKQTMERKNPLSSGNNPSNWETNNGSKMNGKDIDGNLIKGTPDQQNSVFVLNNQQTNREISALPDEPISSANEPAKEQTSPEKITVNQETSKSDQPIIDVIPTPAQQPSESPQLSFAPSSPPLSSVLPLTSSQAPNESLLKPTLLSSVVNNLSKQSPLIPNTSSEKTVNIQESTSTNQPKLTQNKINGANKIKQIAILIGVILLAFISSLGLIYYRKLK